MMRINLYTIQFHLNIYTKQFRHSEKMDGSLRFRPQEGQIAWSNRMMNGVGKRKLLFDDKHTRKPGKKQKDNPVECTGEGIR